MGETARPREAASEHRTVNFGYVIRLSMAARIVKLLKATGVKDGVALWGSFRDAKLAGCEAGAAA